MSELKTYDFPVDGDFTATVELFYLKPEADKVIAELKSQKAQAEDDCAYWKMREGNAANAMHETEEACMFLTKSERHQKYKRCLAMARWCASRSANWCFDPADNELHKSEFYEKWKLRWRELAEEPTWAKFLQLIHKGAK